MPLMRSASPPWRRSCAPPWWADASIKYISPAGTRWCWLVRGSGGNGKLLLRPAPTSPGPSSPPSAGRTRARPPCRPDAPAQASDRGTHPADRPAPHGAPAGFPAGGPGRAGRPGGAAADPGVHGPPGQSHPAGTGRGGSWTACAGWTETLPPTSGRYCLGCSTACPLRRTSWTCWPASGGVGAALENPMGKSLDKLLLDAFTGISPLIARELVFRVGDDPAALREELEKFRAEVQEKRFAPYLLVREGRAVDFTFLPILQYEPETECRRQERFSPMLDMFDETRDQAERVRQRGQDLIKSVTSARDRAGAQAGQPGTGAGGDPGPGAAAGAGGHHHLQPPRHAQGTERAACGGLR